MYTSPRYVLPCCNLHTEQHQVGGRGLYDKRKVTLARESEIVEMGLVVNRELEKKLGENWGEGLKQESVVNVNRLGRACIAQLSFG